MTKKEINTFADDEFYKIIENCANTLIENKENLKNVYFNHTCSMDINFRFRPGEIVTMDIYSQHNVCDKDDRCSIQYY